jgi:mannan endo-1,4-beta-mannosidase
LKALRILIAVAAVGIAGAVAVNAGLHDKSAAAVPSAPDVYRILPTEPGSYIGVYAPPVPHSYAGVTSFTKATGVTPRVVMFYSGWLEPFQVSFATVAARHRAVPLVQIDPTDVSLAAIASGRYDAYLTSYADAVRSYGNAVILSFAHEMNGSWYSWGNRHSSPIEYVAAWRHIVNLFRAAGAENVTWMWTVNVINDSAHNAIPNPTAWWPGDLYVNWIGIDGYYVQPSWRFTSLFGPTIAAVRELTSAPILISETGASPAAGQAAKIADLLAGIHNFGLLGFVWFDAQGAMDWRIRGGPAVAEFRAASRTLERSSR